MSRAHLQTLALTSGAAVLIAAGVLLPPWLLDLVTLALARGIAALGLFVLWRCGLVSFGHALYFGFAGYTIVLLDAATGIADVPLRVFCGAASAGLLGFLLGFIVRRYRAIFFAMLNLAFSMVFYGLVIRNTSLGSTDGFALLRPTLIGAPATQAQIYLIVAIIAFLALAAMHAYLRSAFGKLALAIRDNELRVEFLGLSPLAAVHAKYALSAVLCGIGGALTAVTLGQVDPDSMVNWTMSGELVFIVVIAGSTSPFATLVTSIGFELLRSYTLDIAPRAWQLIFGLSLISVILWRPEGIWPLRSRGQKHA